MTNPLVTRLRQAALVCFVTLSLTLLAFVSFTFSGFPFNPSTPSVHAAPNAPTVLSGKSVATGVVHSCAVTNGNGVVCWGANSYGQLGNGTRTSTLAPAAVQGLSSGVSMLSAGSNFSCAVTTAGGVKCWGDGRFGQLGAGNQVTETLTPVDVEGLQSGVKAISSGNGHTCALTNAGGVKCWGENQRRQLGSGVNELWLYEPVDVVGLSSGATAIGAGGRHTCAVVSGGVKCWGDNFYYQLGAEDQFAFGDTPIDVFGLSSGAKTVTGGQGHTCALLTNGTAKCWGDNNYGQLGTGDLNERPHATDVPELTDIDAIQAGGTHTCAIASGEALCWGGNMTAQLGEGTQLDWVSPRPVLNLEGPVTHLAASSYHSCARVETGEISCWGENQAGQLGIGTPAGHIQPVEVTDLGGEAQSIALGFAFSCALLTNSTVECWGSNWHGTLGYFPDTGDLFPYTPEFGFSPKPVTITAAGTEVSEVVAGAYHACALAGGGVRCWGSGREGQMGNNSANIYNVVPITPTGLTSNVVDLAVGGYALTCAVLENGHVACWGDQAYETTEIAGITNASQVAAGSNHACALSETGRVQCWGRNDRGQVGDGTMTERTSPTAVSGLNSGVQAISAGEHHTCALLNSGDVQCWGYNNSGQIGDGTKATSSTLPVDVIGLPSNITSIAASQNTSCALTSAGDLYCWGLSYLRPPSTYLPTYSAQKMVGLSDVEAIAPGFGHYCVVLSGGAINCWGTNSYGQLGNGEAGYQSSAVAVSDIAELPVRSFYLPKLRRP